MESVETNDFSSSMPAISGLENEHLSTSVADTSSRSPAYTVRDRFNQHVSRQSGSVFSNGELNRGTMAKPDPDYESYRSYQVINSSTKAKEPSNRKSKKESLFIVLNKWSGIVTSINQEEATFTVRLKDLTNSDMPSEQAEFSIEYLSEHDQRLLDEGATLYLYVGYENVNRTRKNSSIIKLNRIRPINPIEEKQAKSLAQEYMSLIEESS